MLPKVINNFFFEKTYIADLVALVFPNRRISNIIPFSFTRGYEGTGEFFVDDKRSLYYGYFTFSRTDTAIASQVSFYLAGNESVRIPNSHYVVDQLLLLCNMVKLDAAEGDELILHFIGFKIQMEEQDTILQLHPPPAPDPVDPPEVLGRFIVKNRYHFRVMFIAANLPSTVYEYFELDPGEERETFLPRTADLNLQVRNTNTSSEWWHNDPFDSRFIISGTGVLNQEIIDRGDAVGTFTWHNVDSSGMTTTDTVTIEFYEEPFHIQFDTVVNGPLPATIRLNATFSRPAPKDFILDVGVCFVNDDVGTRTCRGEPETGDPFARKRIIIAAGDTEASTFWHNELETTNAHIDNIYLFTWPYIIPLANLTAVEPETLVIRVTE